MSEVTLTLFKSSIPSCKTIMANGKYIYFTEGKFATSNKDEIEFLQGEIAAGHPHIYIDSKEKEITKQAYEDPMAALRAKIIEEYKATNGIVTSAALVGAKESIAKAK